MYAYVRLKFMLLLVTIVHKTLIRVSCGSNCELQFSSQVWHGELSGFVRLKRDHAPGPRSETWEDSRG